MNGSDIKKLMALEWDVNSQRAILGFDVKSHPVHIRIDKTKKWKKVVILGS